MSWPKGSSGNAGPTTEKAGGTKSRRWLNPPRLDSSGATRGGVTSFEQIFPITEGDQVSLSGYMLTDNTLLPGSFGLYKIVFRDASGTDLPVGSVTTGQASLGDNPGIDSLPFVDENSAPNTWVFSEAAGTAPAGSVEVVFLGLNVDFGGGVNPIWIDNVAATLPGGAPALLGDVNLDSSVDFLDITPFIAVLSSEDYQCEADCDENGVVDFLDIIPFIMLLTGN